MYSESRFLKQVDVRSETGLNQVETWQKWGPQSRRDSLSIIIPIPMDHVSRYTQFFYKGWWIFLTSYIPLIFQILTSLIP